MSALFSGVWVPHLGNHWFFVLFESPCKFSWRTEKLWRGDDYEVLIYIIAKSQVDMDSQESVGDGSLCYAASLQQQLTHAEYDAPVKELP